MGVRGRKSSAELTLIQRAEQVLVVKRPDPPGGLSSEAAAQWRVVVNVTPADYFNAAMYPVLEAYCRHAVAARKIDQLIQGLENGDGTVAAYDKYLAMHERESRALAALAVRLGLGFATREYKSFGGRKETGGPKPWEKLSR